ncbi:MAG: hypothetical protein II956_10390 [Bacteroidales bacterium]|nr:hypothetical protein [Bacteroidales bacterium]
MKRKYVFPCLMALSVASGCIKEQGEEPFLITRDDIKEYDEKAKGSKKENKDSIAYTLVTAIGGFAEGEAKIDVLDTNTFRVFQSGAKKITDLDCYAEISAQYDNLELNGKTIGERGCVYSHTNKFPIVDGNGCESSSKYTIIKTDTDTETSFKSGCHNLDFNTDYYIRSYAVLLDENDEPCDTIYNQRVSKIHTTLPEDVWVQRNDVNFSNRSEAICCTVNNKIYLYGGKTGSTYFNDMWVYDKESDTWSQKATFNEGTSPNYSGTEKRANGAAFAYPTQTDIVIYIAGGEIDGKTPTEKVMFYSTANDRYCNEQDHPNYNTQVQLYDKNGKAQYEQKPVYDSEGNPMYDVSGNPVTEDDKSKPIMVTGVRSYVEDLPHPVRGNRAFVVNTNIGTRYYIGFGKNESDAMVATFYEYQVQYDMNNPNPVHKEEHILTWTASGSTQGNRARTGEGLYQPVCEVCGSRIIVGTGESSNGGLSKSFYQIKISDIGEVEMVAMAETPETFPARANAGSFFLTYQKNGETHERFYVGTGRTFTEGSSGNLLGDLWYYDFSQEQWGKARDFSNSTYAREGVTGYAITRKDDYDPDVKGLIQEEARGIFILGYGYHNDDPATKNYYKDSWEYLP